MERRPYHSYYKNTRSDCLSGYSYMEVGSPGGRPEEWASVLPGEPQTAPGGGRGIILCPVRWGRGNYREP